MAVGSVFSAKTLLAAPIPDAGSILRDQAPRQELLKQLPTLEKKVVDPLSAQPGVRIIIKGFTFSGYEGIASESELQALVVDQKGKELSVTDLRILTGKITTYIKEKGWQQARAFLPAQDITSGVVRITVRQIKSDGNIVINRDKTVRIVNRVILGYVQPTVVLGQPINLRDAERSMLLIKDMPGVTAKASLVPGSVSGTSGVELDVSEGPLFSGSLSADNQGNPYTGSLRGNVFVSINDPLHRGDQMTLLLSDASGLQQGRIGYSIPVSSDGVCANISYTGMRYKLGKEFAVLQYKGQSQKIDAGFSYPMLRSRYANLAATMTYGYHAFIDTLVDTNIRDNQLNSVTIALNGDRYDPLFGGGYTRYNLGVTTGAHHESIADISLTDTEGTYSRFNLGLARLQHLAERFNLHLSGSAQFSTGNLSSSEKLSLGGPSGVRAYPIGEASGDEGELINAELRYQLSLPSKWGSLQLSGFFDAGHITLNKNRYFFDVTNATDSNDYWLQGAGLGLNYSYLSTFSLSASWAHVIGDNPGRSFAGNNSDGQSNNNRFWLQGLFSF